MARLNSENNNVYRWGILLVFGLMLESCFLLVGFCIWVFQSGISLTTIWNLTSEISMISPEPAWQITETNEQVQTVAVLTTMTNSVGETSAPATVTPSQSSIPVLPVIPNPPSGKIVYTCFDGEYDQICIMNADGKEQRQLTNYSATSFYPSLSPNGNAIVFSSKMDGNFEIYMMDINGENLKKLTADIGNLFAPEISPKENRIIFTRESGGLQAIWVMKLDGKNPHPLFESGGFNIDPTWSPNAMQVAFASAVGGETSLYIIDLTSNKVQQMSPKGLTIGGRSSWSPVGEWLAFYAGEKGSRNLYTVSVLHQELIQITDGGDNLAPSYSTDGKWLAFTSFRDGNNEIYIQSLLDLGVFRLTNEPNADWQPRWGP
jgi:TolB protein